MGSLKAQIDCKASLQGGLAVGGSLVQGDVDRHGRCGRTTGVSRDVGGHGGGLLCLAARNRAVPYTAPEKRMSCECCIAGRVRPARCDAARRRPRELSRGAGTWLTIPPVCWCARVAAPRCCCVVAAIAGSATAAASVPAQHAWTASARRRAATRAAVPGAWHTQRARGAGASDSDSASQPVGRRPHRRRSAATS